jgi:2-C-methyl-D-erythritol 4-phosphate cytidylyltransferase
LKHYAVIVAGGSGQRMNSSVPKQFLKIKNDVILMKSIRAFTLFDREIDIIVALPQDQIDTWKELIEVEQFEIKHTIVEGGATRFHSVKNALSAIGCDGFVAIHDGVRPLVSQKTIRTAFETAEKSGNAVPYIDINDSLRFVDGPKNSTVDRSKYKSIQTPQVFDCILIKKAYEQEYSEKFTDDASVVESIGIKINLVQGNIENIKITTQVDLKIAEALSDYLSV